MTDNELRIKVAELCGWERGPKKEIKCGLWIPVMSCWHKKCDKENWQDEPPNFPKDLNACHEMEKGLDTLGAKMRYLSYLRLVCTGEAKHYDNSTMHELIVICATARQRCEAFVQAMEEEK